MNTKFVYFVNDGKRNRLTKAEIIEYLMYNARYAFPRSYFCKLRRLNYDCSRYALYTYLNQYAPHLLSKFENLYDPFIIHRVCR